MCPIWPVHWVLVYLLVLLPLWLVTCTATEAVASWSVRWSPESMKGLVEGTTNCLNFTTDDISPDEAVRGLVTVLADRSDVASVAPRQFSLGSVPLDGGSWSDALNITANFMGYTTVKLRLSTNNSDGVRRTRESEGVKVTVVRKTSVMDTVFLSSVIVLVSIIFINFGCALDVGMLKRAVLKPVGPVIALSCHYLLLPVTGYLLGLVLFPDSMVLRLGLFFTGVSPAGGASNIWAVTLGGNLDLSITMTAFSTLASFLFIPLWLLTLGKVIFSSGSIAIPYSRIVSSAAGLFVPLVIGYLIQIYCKRLSQILVRILKPFSAILIAFIVIFATITNFYLFKLFTWQIFVAGLALPTLGYIFGWILGSMTKQAPPDVLTIAIESCVQNTGIPIFLLRFCLEQPEADLTTVAPVSVALMTPVPVIIFYVLRRLFRCGVTTVKDPLDDREVGPETDSCPIVNGHTRK